MKTHAVLSIVAAATAALFALPSAAQNFAITKQISPIDIKDPAVVELVGVSALPMELRYSGVTLPEGIRLIGTPQGTNCANVTKAGERCRHAFTLNLDAVSSKKCRLNGNYVLKVEMTCRSGMAGTCKPGTRDVPFSLESENFCRETVVNTSKHWDQWRGPDMSANDVGVGETAYLWFLGAKQVAGGFETISIDTGKTAGMRRGGGAVRIDVGAGGVPWVVNQAGEVFTYEYGNNGRWIRAAPVPGGPAVDVGVGAKGAVWVVGGAKVPGGFAIHRYNNGKWETIPGGAVRVDVDSGGSPWVVNDAGNIYRRAGNGWADISFGIKARDIGVGANGSVFVAGMDGAVYKLNPDGKGWAGRGGSGVVNITVHPKGVPIAANAGRELWVGQP